MTCYLLYIPTGTATTATTATTTAYSIHATTAAARNSELFNACEVVICIELIDNNFIVVQKMTKDFDLEEWYV